MWSSESHNGLQTICWRAICLNNCGHRAVLTSECEVTYDVNGVHFVRLARFQFHPQKVALGAVALLPSTWATLFAKPYALAAFANLHQTPLFTKPQVLSFPALGSVAPVLAASVPETHICDTPPPSPSRMPVLQAQHYEDDF